jgi:hypothetical protein
MKPRAFDNTLESKIVAERIENILRAEKLEQWLSYQTAMTYQQEGRLIPALLPGAYDLEVESPFFYEPLDTNDKVNYKITGLPFYGAEEISIPKIIKGGRRNPETRVFLVPQYWEVRCFFKAWYIFFTMWAFTFVQIPFNFVFWNRPPLFPHPIEIGTVSSDPFGLVPVWQWVEKSKAHRQVISQVRALEFFSPYIAMIFFFTSDGLFTIRRNDTFPGALAGVLERGSSRYYIWRRRATERDLSIVIGQGKLQTGFINSWGADLIGGVPDNPGGIPSI